MKPFVIVNPEAGGGLGKKLWPGISKEIKQQVGVFSFEETNAIGHARVLAAEAAQSGHTCIIAYGGDGTIHEVVNGLHDSKVSPLPELGIISVGTGGDFVKTLGLPKNLKEQIRIIANFHTRTVDVGHVEYRNQQGKKEERLFVNIIDAGLGAEVVRNLQGARKLFGRRLCYLTATVQACMTWSPRKVRIQMDHPADEKRWPEKILAIVIANGQYFGGGMPIAPSASAEDGYFDLIVLGKMHPLMIPIAVPLLYSRQVIRLPNVVTDRVRTLSLTSEENVNLEIDGEPIGSLPATFKVIPHYLTIKAPVKP